MKNLIKLIGVFVLIAVLNACQKDTTLETASEITSEEKGGVVDEISETANLKEDWSFKGECRVENPNNPYDEAGVLHNKYMAYLEANNSAESTLEQLYGAVDEIAYKDYGRELIPGYTSSTMSNEIIEAIKNDGVDAFVQGLEISELQKESLTKLYSIMSAYPGKSLCEVIASIRSFEKSLLAQHSAEELEVVLISSSVARYSLAYWDPKVGGESSLDRAFWKKFFTAVADAIGAAGGAVAGSATVVGGIAGGVMGGIGASTGFAKVWDIFAE